MRLVDFQVCVQASKIPQDEQRSANQAFFPLFESVRLWLREQDLTAPFRKIVVTIVDRSVDGALHGSVFIALGICEVMLAVDWKTCRSKIGNFGWMASIVLDALDHVGAVTQWRSEALKAVVREASVAKPPCAHRFEKLRMTAKASGVVCDLWFEADLDSTAIKARFTQRSHASTEAVVLHRPGPIYLEDDFPVAAARIVSGNYVLMDRNKTVLAQIPIPNN